MKRGEIWQVSLPIVADREQAGQRPCIILQDETYAQASPMMLVVPLTSSLDALRFPATLKLEPLAGTGLRLPSIAFTFQTRAIDSGRFIQRLGVLDAEVLELILTDLDRLTGRTPVTQS